MMVGRLLSFWDGLFSGAMLNFQGVDEIIDLLGMEVFPPVQKVKKSWAKEKS